MGRIGGMQIGFGLGSDRVWIGFGLGLVWVCIGFGSGSDWVRIFCVFLDNCHCKSLSYQVLQTVGASENWVRMVYLIVFHIRGDSLQGMYKMNNSA